MAFTTDLAAKLTRDASPDPHKGLAALWFQSFVAADLAAVHFFSRWAQPTAIRYLAIGVSKLGNGWIYLILLPLVFWGLGLSGWRVVALAGLNAALLHTLYPIIKRRFRRRRPYHVDARLPSLLSTLDEHSFPSGHAMTITGVLAPIVLAWPAMTVSAVLIGTVDGLVAHRDGASLPERRYCWRRAGGRARLPAFELRAVAVLGRTRQSLRQPAGRGRAHASPCALEGARRKLQSKKARALHRPRHGEPFSEPTLETEAAVIGLVADQQHGAMAERLRARERMTHHLGAEPERTRLFGDRQRPQQQRRKAAAREDGPQADRREEVALVVPRDEREPRRGLASFPQPFAGLEKTRGAEGGVEQRFPRRNVGGRLVEDHESARRRRSRGDERRGEGLKDQIKGHLFLPTRTSDPRAWRGNRARRTGLETSVGFLPA